MRDTPRLSIMSQRVMMSIRRWLRRVLMVFVGLTLILGLLTAALHTPPGKTILAGALSRLAARYTDFTLEIEGISGFLPGNMRVETIHLRDPRGDFVTVRGMHLRMSLSELLRGKVHIQQLTIAQLDIWKLPMPKQKWRLPRIPALPFWPTIDALRIERLLLAEAVTGTEVGLSITAQLRAVEGRMFPEVDAEIKDLESDANHVVLSYKFDNDAPFLFLSAHDEVILPGLLALPPPIKARIDGQGNRADWRGELQVTSAGNTLVAGKARLTESADTRLEATLRTQISRAPFLKEHVALIGESLNLNLAVSLDAHGRLDIQELTIDSELIKATLTGSLAFEQEVITLTTRFEHSDISQFPGAFTSEEVLPLVLDATLRGPFESIAITTSVAVNDEPLFDASMHAGISTPLSLQGEAKIRPAALPVYSHPFTADDELSLDFAVNYNEDVFKVAHIDLSGIGLVLSAQGHILPSVPSLEITAHLAATDLMPVGALIAQSMAGALEVDLEANGGADGLAFDMRVQGDALQFASVQAEYLKFGVTGHCGQWTSMPLRELKATLAVESKALSLPGMTSAGVHLDAVIDAPTMDQIELQSLTLTDGNLQLHGTGTVDALTQRLHLSLNASAASLTALPLDIQGMPEGTLQATVSILGGIAPLALETHLDGTLESLSDIPDLLEALTGTRITFAFDGGISEEAITLTDLNLSGSAFEVGGNAAYTRTTQHLNADIQAQLPDLRHVGAVYDQTLTGSVTMESVITGVFEDLSMQASISGKDLILNDAPPAVLNMSIVGSNLTGPGIEVSAESLMEAAGEQVKANATASLESGQLLISPLEIISSENKISGRIAYALDTQTPEAHLSLVLNDLATFGRMVGMPISGTIEGTASYEDAAFSGTLEGQSLAYGESKMESALLKARIQPEDQALNVTGSLEGNQLTTGMAHVNSLKVDAEGTLQETHISGQFRGNLNTGLPELPAFDGAIEGRIFGAEGRVALDAFSGTLDTFDYGLDGAAYLEMSDSGLVISPTTLRVGSGRIFLEGRHGDGSLSGSLRIESFPLELSGLLMDPEFKGVLDGEAHLSGSAADPEVTLTVKLSDASLPIDGAEGLAPLQATLETTLNSSGLAIRGAASMDGTLRAQSHINMPMHFQLSPWDFQFPTGEEISGDAEFELHVLPLLHAFGLVEHYLEGTLNGAFTLGGTAAAPDIRGQAMMQNARYENALTGTLLRNLNLRVEAEATRLRLVECTAQTGSRGSMNASGELHLLYSEHFPFSGTARFDEAQFAQLDYLDGRMTGDLAASGTLKDILVKGELTISPVNISMPDERPVREPPTLEITEIEEGQVIEKSERAEPGLGSLVRLDIACNIPSRMYVRAPILDSEWGGKLHVGGTLADIMIDGRVTVLRGHLDFMSRRFALRDSALLFLGGAPTRPYLDMLAVVDTPSLSAQLKLQGELEDVKLELSSVPELPQDEILSHILFGSDLSRLSPMQAIQLARIASMFNRGLSGVPFFSGNISLPGIDRIDIRTGERADEAVVGIGKYFTDSVYVEVEQGTTTDSGKVSVEVEITPQISIKGDVDARERSGIGVFWRKDY